jgi:signal transduction histidine kinase
MVSSNDHLSDLISNPDWLAAANSFQGGVSLVRDGRYIFVNKYVAQLNGTTPERLVGVEVGLLQPHVSEFIQRFIDFSFRKEPSARFEISVPSAKGLKRHDVSFQRLSRMGDILITSVERDGASPAASESERTSAAVRLAHLGEVARAITIEMAVPLQSIRGSVSAALVNRDGSSVTGLSEDLRALFLNIDSASQRLFRLMASLRGHGAGHDEPMHPVDIKSILDDIAFLIQHRVLMERIEFKMTGDTSGFLISGRQNDLVQAVMAVIYNAIDSVVELEGLRSIELRIAAKESEIEVFVVDNGPGVKEEHRSRVTEDFFTTKGGRRGTGLGLSMSRQILAEHGGNLSFDWSQSQTTVVLSLPRIKTNSRS